VWALDKEYRISRNVLEQHSEKKLGEVAEILEGKFKPLKSPKFSLLKHKNVKNFQTFLLHLFPIYSSWFLSENNILL
jgi:hypothetical protein